MSYRISFMTRLFRFDHDADALRREILNAFEINGWDHDAAAFHLDVERSTLFRYCKRLGLRAVCNARRAAHNAAREERNARVRRARFVLTFDDLERSEDR